MTLKFRWLSFMMLVVASIFPVVFGATPLSAQGFNIQSFSSTTPVTRNGDATLAGNVLRLTPADTSKAGSAWFTPQQSVRGGFTTVFQFRLTNAIGNPTNFPADGLAFVIQNSSDVALGGKGKGIGYGFGDSPGVGISNSLAVEFDTFQNSDLGDPDNNHVAVQSCGLEPNTSAHFDNTVPDPCKLGLQSLSPTAQNLHDGNVHTVVINYDPCTGECSGTGTLKVYLDGSSPVLTVSLNLSSKLSLAEAGKAWVGFTAATGAFFENNDILNWSFTPHEGTTTNAILTFPVGTNVSQIATFNCSTDNTSCSNPNGHSIKFTVSQVKTQITVVISATEVDGDGTCEASFTEDTDFDCRFARVFGIPPTQPPSSTSVKVPFCYPYSNGHCFYYRVENPPPGSAFAGPIAEYIAWNPTLPPPSGYDNNPQMYDDPSAPPFDLDHQFVRIITTYYNNGSGQVGTDPGVGGQTDDFNDFAVAFPPTPPGSPLTFILLPPLSLENHHFHRGSMIAVKFRLKQGNTLINNAATAPNHVGIAVLDSNHVRQPINSPGGSQFFTFNGNHYQFNLATSSLKPGMYEVQINSNLFQQTVNITITPGVHDE